MGTGSLTADCLDRGARWRAGFPAKVAATGAGILAAAEAGDYGLLRPWLDPSVFLSDLGFGTDEPDPIGRWEQLGLEPLRTVHALLQMTPSERQTNEGLLYPWPRYSTETTSGALDPRDRDLFLSVMSPKEIADLFAGDLGYNGPRLGLRDGTWWFFISGGA